MTKIVIYKNPDKDGSGYVIEKWEGINPVSKIVTQGILGVFKIIDAHLVEL